MYHCTYIHTGFAERGETPPPRYPANFPAHALAGHFQHPRSTAASELGGAEFAHNGLRAVQAGAGSHLRRADQLAALRAYLLDMPLLVIVV